MNFPHDFLSSFWLWASNGAFLLVLALAVYLAPWHRLKDSGQLNVWLGTCVALLMLWTIKAGVKPGLNFHLLGATAFTLMFGPWLAIVGLGVVLTGVTLAGMSQWEELSINGLVMNVLPVLVSYGMVQLTSKKLPHHFFIYIFLNAFLGGALAVAARGAAATWLLAASGAYTPDYLYSNYLPYYILMAWSEAMATGMIMTLMVVYRPEWVGTFDDASYIRNK
jgi:uncharacterized membrane protein